MKVTMMGYTEIDNGEEGEELPWQGVMVGRRSFGKFNRPLEVCTRVLIRGETGILLKRIHAIYHYFVCACKAKLTNMLKSRSSKTFKPPPRLPAIQTARMKIAKITAKMIAIIAMMIRQEPMV